MAGLDLVVEGLLRGDCACERAEAVVERGRSLCCKKKSETDLGLTSRDCATVQVATDVQYLDVVRNLYMGDGDRFQVGAFESVVAAGKGGSQDGSHVEGVGEHVYVRRLKSEYHVLLPTRLAQRSCSSCLDRDDPPALRICMETTRASSLWQAAAVRPEPERMPSLKCCVDSRSCIARVWDCSCFAILTNVAASRALRDAPSSRRILSAVLSVRVSGYSFVKTKLRGTAGSAAL